MSRRHRRRPRLELTAALIAVAALAACSPSADAGSRVVGEPPGAPATTTTAAPPSTTAAPPATFPPVRTDLDPPEMPDPLDILDEAMQPLTGFDTIDSEPTELLETVGFRLSGIVDGWMRAVLWEHLDVEGEPVLVLGMYPAAGLRADPFAAVGMASVAAGEDGDVEEVTVAGATAYRTQVGDAWWYLWNGHGPAFVVIGPEEAAEPVLEPLVTADADIYVWETGDCLYSSPEDGAEMPYAPFGDDMVVPCDGPHSHYVLATTTFDDDAGGVNDADYAELRNLCETSYEDHVGLPSHQAAVDLVIYAPDEDEWARGDRYGACVIGRYLDGEPALVDDAYRGAGESVRLDRRPGDCYGLGGVTSPPVACDQPHNYEYLGTVELPDEAPYPPDSAASSARFACNNLLMDRLTRGGGGRIEAYAWPVPPHRWEQGERTVLCFAFPFSDADAPVVIVGPLTGEWRIVVADDVVDA